LGKSSIRRVHSKTVVSASKPNPLLLNFRFINDKSNQIGYVAHTRLARAEQLLKADMVKSGFSAGIRVEHTWVKVSEVQVENHLVKGTLEDTPTEIKHVAFGNVVFVPFKDIEDIWIGEEVSESVKRLLEIKERARIGNKPSQKDCFRNKCLRHFNHAYLFPKNSFDLWNPNPEESSSEFQHMLIFCNSI
jgi:hypothetical protein